MRNKRVHWLHPLAAWVLVIGPAAWPLLLGTAAFGAEKKGQPNVVLFVTDDQGQDAGCYGNRVLKTPHLDQLAAEGTRFPHAFCTTASCSASRSVILTGLYNHANGQYGHQHGAAHFSALPTVKSLPVLLRQAGYRTARIGKFHVAPDDIFDFDAALTGNPRSAVEMADNCKAFIGGDKPFFLYFCTADPHRGGGRAKEIPLQPDRFGNKPQGQSYPGVQEAIYDPRDVLVPPFLPDTPTCRAELAQYYQAISRLDQGLGRLVKHLKDAGKYDNTLIVFISDNGIPFPGAKTTAYDSGVRLPCVVRAPEARKRGGTCDALVNWTDIAPTILDAAGGKYDKFHGRSFLPVLDEDKPKGWDETFASHTFHEITMYYPMRVVRDRRYKLIWNIAHPLPFPFASDLWAAPTWQDVFQKGPDAPYGKRTVKSYIHRPAFELYDLQTDLDEVKNLAGDPGQAKRLEAMKEKLKAFQKRTSDPWLSKWEYE